MAKIPKLQFENLCHQHQELNNSTKKQIQKFFWAIFVTMKLCYQPLQTQTMFSLLKWNTLRAVSQLCSKEGLLTQRQGNTLQQLGKSLQVKKEKVSSIVFKRLVAQPSGHSKFSTLLWLAKHKFSRQSQQFPKTSSIHLRSQSLSLWSNRSSQSLSLLLNRSSQSNL